MSWQPLLSGGLRAAANRRADEIAADLHAAGAGAAGDDPFLATGHAGLAVFFAHYSLARQGDERATASCIAHLERAIEAAQDRESSSLALFTGWCGIAWAAAEAGRVLGRDLGAGLGEELDSLVEEALLQSPWRTQLDLAHGLAGVAVYLLDHPRAAVAQRLLPAVCEILERGAETGGPGLTSGLAWRTAAAHLAPASAARHPAGRLDLGVAHGVPGIMAVLARAAAAHGIDAAADLFDAALAWLRPALAAPGMAEIGFFAGEPAAARTAWCYGNPGVAAAILDGLVRSDDAAAIEWALGMARCAADRPRGQTGVVDATFCHGAAGLGHLFNRLHQVSGDAAFAAAARAWFGETLALRRAGGSGGFMNWWPESGDWHDDAGILVGAAGIGLALLAATSPHEPTWDSIFLLPRLGVRT